MKFVFLETATSEVAKYAEGVRKLGHDVVSMRYDVPGLPETTTLARIREHKPDAVVYIGQRWGTTLSASCLAQITAKIAPTVLICSDAADAPWHSMLRDYDETGAFSVHVAIDGSHKWPNSARHITALTPVDPVDYLDPPRPHAERNTIAAFAGNAGGGDNSVRTQTLVQLLQSQTIEVRTRSPLPFTYQGYASFLCNLRISLNVAQTGTEASLHVKGRVLESGLAGCCLIESKGAPTNYWFRPGLDYLEYSSPDEARDIILHLRDKPEATQAMGTSLRARVLAEHSPRVFWDRIFERIGLKTNAPKVANA